MRIPRIYTGQKLLCNRHFVLDDNAAHHVYRVLRLKPGAELILFDGSGKDYHATITFADKYKVSLQTTTCDNFACKTESNLDITLIQGVSRSERMDYTIQKAVELGVDRIIPVISRRCTVKLDANRAHKRIRHWQKVIISACEQCGRSKIPALEDITTYENLFARQPSSLNLILDPAATSTLTQLPEPANATISLIIGPEGGLNDSELNLAKTHKYIGLRLGPRILRTETAAVAAITALQTLWGDIGAPLEPEQP